MRRVMSLLLPAVLAILSAGQVLAQHSGGAFNTSPPGAGIGFRSGLAPRSSTYPAVSTRSGASLPGTQPGIAHIPQFRPENSNQMYPRNGDRRPHSGDRDHRGRGDRQPYFGGYGGYVFPNFVGYPYALDSGFYSQDDDQGEQSSTPAPRDNGREAPGDYSEAPPPPPEVSEDTYRAPYSSSPAVAQPVHPQPATTLVFNDGKPNQVVHNYVLTGTTLYELDGDTRKDIPLSEINVPETIKINRADGVEFTLPASR